ncbi:hypothetical protein G6F22_021159 [Rhizopus arrhizus]|nr:hypothetical protein G6F22_021159 [Rhizopus arrhizus]
MIAEKVSKVPPQALQAIREGTPMDDPKLHALTAFVKDMVQTRGNPSQASLQTFTDAGYSEQQALQVVLAIAVKTISNYTNHLDEISTAPHLGVNHHLPEVGLQENGCRGWKA